MTGMGGLNRDWKNLFQVENPPQSVEFSVGAQTYTLTVKGWIGETQQKEVEASQISDPDFLDGSPDDLKYCVAFLDTGQSGADGGSAPADMVALIPGCDSVALPDWLAGNVPARIAGLGVKVNSEGVLLDFEAAIALAEARAWDIVPGMISVGDLRFELAVRHPLDDERRSIAIGAAGVIGIGRDAEGTPAMALSVQVRAFDEPETRSLTAKDDDAFASDASATSSKMADAIKDDAPIDASLLTERLTRARDDAKQRQSRLFSRIVVEGGLALGPDGRPRDVPLSGLLSHFGWSADTLGGAPCITTADFRYDTRGGEFALAVTVAGERTKTGVPLRQSALSLFGGAVKLDEAAVTIRGSSKTGRVTGDIATVFEMAGEKIELRALCGPAGVVFEGHWQHSEAEGQSDGGMTAATFGEWLGKKFNGVSLDPALESLMLRSASLLVDTAAGTFGFELEGSLAFGNFDRDAVTAHVRLEVSRDEKGFSGRFEGVLLLDFDKGPRLEFDLDILRDAAADAGALVGAFRETTAETNEDDKPPYLSLASLARNLNLSKDFARRVETAKFSIPAAYLAHVSEGGIETSALGMEIAGGLDLSKITLPAELELLRESLDGLSDISVNVDLAYLSGKEMPALVGPVIERHGFHLPAGEGLSLMVRAKLGEDRFDLKRVDLSGANTFDNPQDVDLPKRDDNDAPPPQARVSDAAGARWIEIQRAFGPIRLRRIGAAVEMKDDDVHLSALLDAALEAEGLEIALDGLRITGPLSRFAPKLSLDGLGIDFRNGDIEVGGALLQTPTGFAGELLLRAEDLTLVIEGDYRTVDEKPSLVAYAVIEAPFGGPPCFFVTGIAAGFGYNRAIHKPELADIPDFALVSPLLPGGHAIEGPAALGRAFEPKVGAHFLALGLSFTSFKMIDSFALAILKLADRVELDLVGVSTLDLPIDGKGLPVAHVRLLWSASFVPEEGLLDVKAGLSDDSFIFDRRCRPHGEMAFRAWLAPTEADRTGGAGPSQGDFVLTIGGYHPDYVRKPYEPVASRVTLNWSVSRALTIKGSAYLALTGSAAMAGASLEATYDADISVGHIHASLSARADFLFGWSPVHYDAKVHVQVSATFTYNFFGTHQIDFHASAELHIWGPEFAMRAHVSVTVVGFEVAFQIDYNTAPRKAVAIRFETFLEQLLPPDPISMRAVAGTLANGGKGASGAGADAGADEDILMLDPHTFEISIQTLAPFGLLNVLGSTVEGFDKEEVAAIGVRPCGFDRWSSTLHVTLEPALPRASDDAPPPLAAEVVTGPVPTALWEKCTPNVFQGVRMIGTPDVNGPQSIRNVPVGLRLKPQAGAKKDAPGHTQSGVQADRRRCLKVVIPMPGTPAFPAAELNADDLRSLRQSLEGLIAGHTA